MVQLSHLYMTTGKTIGLTIRTFVGKVMSLLFNMLSSLAIAFLPRSKCLFISWLLSTSAVTLESKKIKSVTVSIFFPHLFAMKRWDHAGLEEAQARIKIARKNINNLRYADDTTLMAESDKLKEESEKAGSKLNIQKTKIIASGHISSWQIDGETMSTVKDFISLGSKDIADDDCSHEIK